MGRAALVLLFLYPALCYSQKHNKEVSNDIVKWNKSIIDLELRSDSPNILQVMTYVNKLGNQGTERYLFLVDSIMKTFPRFTGTAIFIKFKGGRYLVTARHVLNDKQQYINAKKEGKLNA